MRIDPLGRHRERNRGKWWVGEWGMGNGERGMGNGERGMGNGERGRRQLHISAIPQSHMGATRDTNRATPDMNIHEFWLLVNNSPTIPCSVAERRNPLQVTELLLSRGSVAPRRTFTALAQNQINRELAREANDSGWEVACSTTFLLRRGATQPPAS